MNRALAGDGGRRIEPSEGSVARIARVFGPLAVLVVSGACVSVLGDTAWADGEVRDLSTRRPIPGARVVIEAPGGEREPTAADRTNGAGRFAVLHTAAGGGATTRLVVLADGFKPAEYALPMRQSNLLIAYMAPAGSALSSRIEQMPAPAEGGNGQSDSSSGH
jgi:hypothetical protein